MCLDSAVAELLPCCCRARLEQCWTLRCLNAKQEYVEDQHIYMLDINSKRNCPGRTLFEACTGVPTCQSHTLII